MRKARGKKAGSYLQLEFEATAGLPRVKKGIRPAMPAPVKESGKLLTIASYTCILSERAEIARECAQLCLPQLSQSRARPTNDEYGERDAIYPS